ncbi:hypothetical protein Tco_0401753 [Tanacetum coccineum]
MWGRVRGGGDIGIGWGVRGEGCEGVVERVRVLGFSSRGGILRGDWSRLELMDRGRRWRRGNERWGVGGVVERMWWFVFNCSERLMRGGVGVGEGEKGG